MRNWFKSGTPWIWLNAGAISVALVAVFGLLFLILVRGMSHFWPANVEAFYYQNANNSLTVIAEVIESETVPADTVHGIDVKEGNITRYLVKTGNRDLLGSDFRWLYDIDLIKREQPDHIMVLERIEWGNFYGYLNSVYENGVKVSDENNIWSEFEQRLERTVTIREQILDLEQGEIGAINYQLERLRLKEKRLIIDNELTEEALEKLTNKRDSLNSEYAALLKQTQSLYADINRDSISATVMDGKIVKIPLEKIVKAWQPNSFSTLEKLGFYVGSLWNFVSEDPREANTEGGIFPAIFGTVLMVILMAILVTPFGVIAAVYLREYARQGALIRVIRIAVNNLAGVPSIVYGVFGLGFFVYFLGGSIDSLFYPEAQPSPTFGTPGLLWSSLTLALLTLPVVIVATEEGLSRIPISLREGSLGLGATKAETLWRVVLPMASPAIMTGLILAVARAAGEVAPLMLVGVVKLAPSLPLDGNFPFLHLDRKFMHLGFHIYDVGFQSPNVEAARPLVYATSFLLVVVIVGLNLTAINLRNKLREKYRALDN
ncbi:MAG: phosphate ABC transporter permease PtsA [endosymbiont of Galathealinum brachiosum]|uniref:Phosphate transport system permease protein PstA n=1 Tax=endosymbiont of Galathealinum brachiosum TaxID=2200906 RepID=A0A370DHY9_9GAMM|nr:MAG: phosphate ABC transporter permease PtsA [endosymbiont of Galathealinum brachiosum]